MTYTKPVTAFSLANGKHLCSLCLFSSLGILLKIGPPNILQATLLPQNERILCNYCRVRTLGKEKSIITVNNDNNTTPDVLVLFTFSKCFQVRDLT